jgi:SP family sugar:H+ symporter-like MFS transporter
MTIGRIVAGVGVGILSIGVPMYQSEVCPREIRGPVVASYQLMITVGILSKCCSIPLLCGRYLHTQ